MQRRTPLIPLVALVSSAALLVGCTPGGAAGDAARPTAPTEASTELTAEEVTLTLMSTPESGAATEATIAAFEAAHPNITVEYSQTSYQDYNQSVNLNLASDDSPDIALLNAVANTVKNDLVLPLDDYSELYGWDDFFPSNQLNQWRVTDNGTTLGEGGTLYAAPAGFSLVGLFYNKAIAKQLGIEPPSTLEELESAMATAHDGGVKALQVGNAEGHASFLVQLIGQGIDGADTANAWAFGHEGEDFITDGNSTAAKTLVAWQEAGYIGEATAVNGTDLQTAVSNFVAGDGLFFVDGIWDADKITKGLGADAGFVSFPGPQATGIGSSVAYAISSKSKHPNEAAAFLDFLRSPEASRQQFDQGFMPNDPSAANPEPNTVQADIVTAWTRVSEANGVVAFNNNATATMDSTLTAGTQQLIAGQIDSDRFLQTVQDDWLKTHGN